MTRFGGEQFDHLLPLREELRAAIPASGGVRIEDFNGKELIILKNVRENQFEETLWRGYDREITELLKANPADPEVMKRLKIRSFLGSLVEFQKRQVEKEKQAREREKKRTEEERFKKLNRRKRK